MPSVIPYDEMWRELERVDGGNEINMSFSIHDDLPLAHLVCPYCHYGWNIEDIDDCVRDFRSETMPISGPAGMTLGQFWESLEGMTDADRSWQPEMLVRNDRFIDLSPKYPGTDKDYEKELVKNKNGWMSAENLSIHMGSIEPGVEPGKPNPAAASYVVQPGDETHVNARRYYHVKCKQASIDSITLGEFKKAFLDAGIQVNNWLGVENEYGSRSYRGNWYSVMTNYGQIKIGWRKRVIEVKFPCFFSTASFFPKENVTKFDTSIHAWSYDKLVEYLKVFKSFCVRNEPVEG